MGGLQEKKKHDLDTLSREPVGGSQSRMIAASSPTSFGNEDPFDALSATGYYTFCTQISRVQYNAVIM